MSCGAAGCNTRAAGAPRVGVPRRDESVATGDGALCDASTGPATRTAQRVGRGRVGRCALPQEHPAAGQPVEPQCKPAIATRECARLARSESRARVRAARNAPGAHGTAAEEGTAGAGRVVHCLTLLQAPRPNAQQEPPWPHPALRAPHAPASPHPSPHPPLSTVKALACIAVMIALRRLKCRSSSPEEQSRYQSDVAALRPTHRPTHTAPQARAQSVRVRRQRTGKTGTSRRTCLLDTPEKV